MMPVLARALYHAAMPLCILVAVTSQPARLRGSDHRPPAPVADSVAGEWKANGHDPRWNGRFTLVLALEQVGDSLHGTYRFELERAMVTPPADIFGRIRGNKIQLQDRADKFWLDATLGGTRMTGRLAGNSRERANALPIVFERVH